MKLSSVKKIKIIYFMGRRDDPEGKEGLAHLIEHCLLKMPIGGENLIEKCSKYGALLNASTSIDYITVHIQINTNNIDEIIQLFNDKLNEFAHIENLCLSSLENEKKVIFKEMASKRKNESSNNILGSKNSVKNIEIKDLANGFLRLSKINSKIIVQEEEKKTEHIKVINTINISKTKVCVVNKNTNEYFAALSINTDFALRRNIVVVTEALLKFLYNNKLQVKTNYSIGYIGIYIEGKLNDIISTIKKLVNIKAEEFIKLVGDFNQSNTHILSEINNQLLHLGNVGKVDNKSLLFENLVFQIYNNLSCVTNINDVQLLKEIFREKKCKKPKSISYDVDDIFRQLNRNINNSTNEYVQVSRSNNFFHEDKYVSHIFWSLIDGIDGYLFKEFSIENSRFYSYKFYSREFCDFGYRVLYVYTTSDKNKEKISEWFNQVLIKMYSYLCSEDIDVAKKKLITQYSLTNKKVAQEYLNMAFYLSNNLEVNTYLEYEKIIESITLEQIKTYIFDLLNSKSSVI